MNKFHQIFELAKQVDLIQWDKLPSGAITPNHESVAKAMKFAELIVRECAKVCLDQRDPSNLNYNPSVKFAEAIEKHFGV
jgi:hypothetical protein